MIRSFVSRSVTRRLAAIAPSVAAAALIGAVLASHPLPIQAQAPAGNADAGKNKALTCMGCHGNVGMRNPYPNYHIPKIGGQHPEYIVNALKAYKSGDRNHETMRAQAASLSDQDMADIAAWLSSLGKPN